MSLHGPTGGPSAPAPKRPTVPAARLAAAAYRRRVWSFVAALLAASFVAPSLAAEAAPAVIVAHLNGAVGPVSAGYVHRVVEAAATERAALLVITIDTPGGLDSSMREMVQDLLSSSVPSVVYVWPPGARAASAGVFVAQAANLVAMAPATTIGAAHPVAGGGETIQGDLRDKVTNDAAAYIAGLAKQHGRNDTWVQEAVRSSVALDAQQAVDERVADLLAADLPTLLSAIDGRVVRTSAGELTVQTAGARVEELPMHPVELALQKIFEPDIAYLLLTIGFFALLIELFHPGALLPGVTGVVCLALAFAAAAALPMNWSGVLLILLALVLFVLDIKAAAHGALTLAGSIAFVIGSLLLYSPPGPRSPTLPEVSVSMPLVIGTVAAAALFSILVVGTAVRLASRRSLTPTERLVGSAGIARSVLDPSGTVLVGGQVWSARLLDGKLEVGAPVRIVGRRGLTLEVESAAGADGPGEGAP